MGKTIGWVLSLILLFVILVILGNYITGGELSVGTFITPLVGLLIGLVVIYFIKGRTNK